MGSQRVAKLSSTKSARIQRGIRSYEPRGGETAAQASSVAATSIGSFTKTSPFVQCLSSHNVEDALEFLIEFSNRFKFRGASPDDVFKEYDIPEEKNRPFAAFSANAIKKLREKWTEQQQSTESAHAVEDAFSQTIMDILAKTIPRSSARTATKDQFAEAFRQADARHIAGTLLENTITNLIGRVLDAGRGSIPPSRTAEVKKRIREDFAPRLTRAIDRMAREAGIRPSKIPSNIPKWAKRLETFIERYRA